VDEYAWLVASRDFSGCPLVTVGMDKISFHQPVQNGSILRFNIKPIRQGESSIQYNVDVYADAPGASEEVNVFSTTITFAHVDTDGNKKPLPVGERLRSECENF
jgi:acyl-CoA hydrolase